MKEQMKISDMGFTPNTNMLKSKKWRGQPVLREQSEKFVICGRKREGHWPSHQGLCTVTLTFPYLILPPCADLNPLQGW